jgi:hypothetical protein
VLFFALFGYFCLLRCLCFLVWCFCLPCYGDFVCFAPVILFALLPVFEGAFVRFCAFVCFVWVLCVLCFDAIVFSVGAFLFSV